MTTTTDRTEPDTRAKERLMSRWGRLVVRRRRVVLLCWAALLVVTGVIGSSAFSVLSTDFGAGSSTESGRVAQQLESLEQTGGQLAVVAGGIDVDDPAVEDRLKAQLAAVAAVPGVLDVADPWSAGPAGAALRSTDGRAALVVVTLAGGLDDDHELAVAHRVEAVAQSLDAPTVLVGG